MAFMNTFLVLVTNIHVVSFTSLKNVFTNKFGSFL